MKSKKTKVIIIAISLLAITAIVLFIAVKGKTPENNLTDSTEIATSTPADSQTVPDISDTSELSQESKSSPKTTEDISEDKSDASGSNKESTTKKPSAPTSAKPASLSSKDEIVAYYVSAHNLAKSTAKTAYKAKGGAVNYKGVMEVNNSKTLEKLGKSLFNQFAGIEEENLTFTGRKEIIANAPAKTVAKCALKASNVKKASCVDKGSYYEVTVYLNCDEQHPEINPHLGSGMTGTVFNIIESDEIESYVKHIPNEGLLIKYVNCWFKAKIDKKTGRLLETYQEYPCYLCFEKALGISDIRVGLQLIEEWSFTY